MSKSISVPAAPARAPVRSNPPRSSGDTLVASPARRSTSRPAPAVATSRACLVLSDDANRRHGFVEAAESAGWSAIPCDSVGEAMQQAARWRSQLAVVDLGEMPSAQKSAYLQFAGKIASREALLLVSDEPTADAADTELLARQAGAWLYLTTPDFDAGLESLFADARRIAEKLGAEATPSPIKTA